MTKKSVFLLAALILGGSIYVIYARNTAPRNEATEENFPAEAVAPSLTENEKSVEKREEPKAQATPNSESVNTEASEKKPYADFHEALAANLAGGGFSYEVVECLEKTSRENLSLPKPLSFDGMATKCADKAGLSAKEKAEAIRIFHKSVDDSQGQINLSEWYSCALKRKLSSPCMMSAYTKRVESFYQSMEQTGEIISKSIFTQMWTKEVGVAQSEIIEQCPKDLDFLNEIFAYECL